MKRLLILLLGLLFLLPIQAQNKVNEVRSGGIQITNDPPRVYRKILFWTNANFDSYIKVYVNGRYQGKITKRYSSAPSCGNANCVTFEFLVQQGVNYEIYGVDASNTRFGPAHKVTLNSSCNPLCLHPMGGGSSSRSSSSGSSSSGSYSPSTYGSNGSSYDSSSSSSLSPETRQAAQNLGASIGSGLGYVLANSGRSWDPDCHRIDLGIGWGVNYGGLGVALNWQAPVVIGISAGLGYNPVYKKYYGANKAIHWNVMLQMWCTDNWNFELGWAKRYFKKYDQTKGAFVMSTNYQHQIWGPLGIKGGIGCSLSGKKGTNDVYARFEWNLGLVVRLFAN